MPADLRAQPAPAMTDADFCVARFGEPDASRVRRPCRRAVGARGERREHLFVVAWERDGVEMVGTERARAHHAHARHAEQPILLERQAAEEHLTVEDQHEPRVGTGGVLEPP